MGLTARKSLKLGDVGLAKLYDLKQEVWAGMAREAYEYTAEFVKSAGQPVRRDDLIPLLIPVLEVNDLLRAFLSEYRLSQNYWYLWFAELIVDRMWEELTTDEEDEASDDERN